MATPKTVYRCVECGYSTPKWLGKCPACAAWNTLQEERETPRKGPASRTPVVRPEAVRLGDVTFEKTDRSSTGFDELDRVLGGGLVEGAAVLIGGDPGIGKSTLMLQAAHNIAASGLRVLYVTGEESLQQTKLRASRLGVSADELYVLAETFVESIIVEIERVKPAVVMIDSIQTTSTESIDGAPGTVGQVREVTAAMVSLAKTTGVVIFLVGHVTKSGAIAGPKVIEHQVDTVLYFEGEHTGAFRILRAIKNRFGSTNEIGVFEMRATGLVEVSNPSELFLEHRSRSAPGTAVAPCIEGSRPILVEVQALTGSNSYGTPQRAAMGIDRGRLSLLAAVLERRAGLALSDRDIFLNVVGGLRVTEPAVDLAVAAAMSSALYDKPNDPSCVYFGEVGLAGEVRSVASPESRISEAAKLGFKRCVMPKTSAGKLSGKSKLEIAPVETVAEALEVM